MRVLAIIGNHPRNLGLFKKLLDQKKIFVEGLILFKREDIIPKPDKKLSKELKKLWNIHFRKRYIAEKKYFNYNHDIIKGFSKKIEIYHESEFNKKKVINFVKKNKFDACFITGIPIIKDPLLNNLPINTVNLHLGLIPFYKGAITMFWPFYFLEPAMAGTTYHIIDKFVDNGEILHNNIPKLEKGDGMHDVACKAIIQAHNDLPKVIKEIKKRVKHRIKPKKDYSLKYRGKLFIKADWKPEMLRVIYSYFKDRIVDAYLDNKIQTKKPKLIKLK